MSNISEQSVFDILKYQVDVGKDGMCRYYNKAGQLHRMEGPAVEWEGGRRWYQNGQLHRTDGPAVVYTNGTKYWWQNGLLHCTGGPAVEYPTGHKRWFINGVEMSESEFLAATQPAVELTVADIEKLLGKRVKIIK